MAGPQSKTQAGERQITPYKVPDTNRPPSGVFFNQVKAYFKEKWSLELKLFADVFGSEEKVFDLLYKEMTAYSFGTESNNITHFYFKYKEHIREAKEELSRKVCSEVQSSKAISNQSAEDATQTKEAQE